MSFARLKKKLVLRARVDKVSGHSNSKASSSTALSEPPSSDMVSTTSAASIATPRPNLSSGVTQNIQQPDHVTVAQNSGPAVITGNKLSSTTLLPEEIQGGHHLITAQLIKSADPAELGAHSTPTSPPTISCDTTALAPLEDLWTRAFENFCNDHKKLSEKYLHVISLEGFGALDNTNADAESQQVPMKISITEMTKLAKKKLSQIDDS
ncbi:hypothetical protein EG329_008251 [Mollisiaceae sp. DMI_Dod_QoI]|nr:hypothetical protein EG329_008251 [Helotiales sp. DMI_Dod_QoI]